MSHHLDKDLVNRHSLKNIQSNKKNVAVILWNSAGNKQRYCMTSYQRGGAEFGKILPCLIYIKTSVRQSPILVRI